MSRVVAGVFLAVLLAELLTPAAHAAGRVIVAKQMLAGLRHGPVEMRKVTVLGQLDLSALATVKQPLTCIDCSFTGSVNAQDAVFLRAVDLSGSTFRNKVQFKGADFRDDSTFESTSFYGHADFSFAVFALPADFAVSEFAQGTSFRSVRFMSGANFVSATFEKSSSASFRGASFSGRAEFAQAEFDGTADFSQADFISTGEFAAAAFHGVLFSDARFEGDATFHNVFFGESGGTDSRTSSEVPPAYFNEVTAESALSFAAARVNSPLILSGTTAKTLTLAPLEIYEKGVLQLDQVSADDFSMDLKDVKQVDGKEGQRAALELIQSSDKARGDFVQANDAYYSLRSIEARHYPWPLRALDFVFFRGIAGYLVRWWHPLIAILVIAAIASLVRIRPRATRSRGHRWRSLARGGIRFGQAYTATLTAILSRSKDRVGEATPHNGEVVIYRILLACVIIGAYATPGVRDLVDLLR